MANPEHVEIVKSGADLIERMGGAYPIDGFDLRDADLEGVTLEAADLMRANLENAILSSAMLSGSNLHGANLRNASLMGTDLTLCNLELADLRGADLSYANLAGAMVSGVNLETTHLFETILGDIDLNEARGLETVIHGGPSVIDERTLRKSWPLPDVFLRGVGLSDDMINFAKDSFGKAVEFYSCFISYSSKDDEFARRLHTDLQAEGVRCWFAPEHMKTGDVMDDRIDESIRLYEKLLLIISRDSVESWWVEREVERAVAKERRVGRTVLFPVRLDDAVMEAEGGWPERIRDARHIGDFSAWKDHDAYQKSFERLLRDLKSGAKD